MAGSRAAWVEPSPGAPGACPDARTASRARIIVEASARYRAASGRAGGFVPRQPSVGRQEAPQARVVHRQRRNPGAEKRACPVRALRISRRGEPVEVVAGPDVT